MYIQVNIGRNIGTEPMDDKSWSTFKGRVAYAIYNSANCWEAFVIRTNVELHDGMGRYNGITEDSSHISSYWEDGFDLDQLREELRTVRDIYGQDSIALLTESELV